MPGVVNWLERFDIFLQKISNWFYDYAKHRNKREPHATEKSKSPHPIVSFCAVSRQRTSDLPVRLQAGGGILLSGMPR
jgi:hypothetical protein